jgi:MFS family permease
VKGTRVHRTGIAAALALLGDSALYVVLPTEQSLGFGAIETGILLSANRFVRIAFNDPTARWIQRVGLRGPLTLALLLAAATTFGYAHAGFALFVALRVLWGLAWSLLRNGANAAVLGEDFERRGELQGTFRALSRIGSLAAVLGGAWLVGRVGFARGFEWLALGTLPGIAVALGMGSKTLAGAGSGISGISPSVRPGGGVSGISRSLRGGGGTLGVSVSAFFINAAAGSLLLATASLGVARFPHALLGFDVNPATLGGLAVAGRWLGEILVAPLAGRIADRHGRRPVVVVGGLLAAGALVGCAAAGSAGGFVAFAALAFGLVSATQTGLDAIATDHAREDPVALGRYFTVVDVGTAVGPLVGPYLARHAGLTATYAGSALVVAAVAGAYVHRRRQHLADHTRLHADG